MCQLTDKDPLKRGPGARADAAADRARQIIPDGQGGRNSRGDGNGTAAAWRFGTRRAARASEADRPSHRAHARKRRPACSASLAAAGMSPGARMVRLGLDIVAASMLRAPRHAILEALSQQIGETCNFGVMAGSHVVYLDRVEFGLAFRTALRARLARAAALHVDGQAVLESASCAEACVCYCARFRSTATRKTRSPTPRRLEAELEKIQSDQSLDRQSGISGRRGMCRRPCAAMQVGSRLPRLPFPRRSRACRCNRDCNTFRCSKRRRNG